MLWPTMASQRSRTSVFSLSRWLCARSGVFRDLITDLVTIPVYRAAPQRTLRIPLVAQQLREACGAAPPEASSHGTRNDNKRIGRSATFDIWAAALTWRAAWGGRWRGRAAGRPARRA